MATSEQDEDSSWGDGGAQLPLVLAEGLLPVAFQFAGNILCRVVAGHFAQLDNTSASILVSANSLDNGGLRLRLNLFLNLGRSGLSLPLVHGPAGVHSRTGVAADAPGQNRVPAPVLLLGRFFVSLCHLTQSKLKQRLVI